MKTASADLINLLASREYNYCGLYRFDLVTGGTLYYSSGDVDISFGGHIYTAGGSSGPYFDRSGSKAKCHWKIGVQVDTLTFDVIPGTATVQGEPFLSAVRQGVFDAAELTFSHAYWPRQGYQTPVIPTGVVTMFVGRVAEIDAGRSMATFSVNSHLELLNLQMPRNLYQAACVNTLYDASCTLLQSNFAASGTVTVGSSGSLINTALATHPSGYYDQGKVTFCSGVNAGLWRSVQTWFNGPTGSSIAVLSPFPNAPSPGDAFTIYAGCDKSIRTCASKFRNLANFRGMPFIPTPETAV